MIHKIKAMYDEGRGSSLRAIAAELRISRNTVRRYLGMSAEEVVAYQGRGVCPSCNARRMAETAVHLVDHVFPPLPVRQWMLSVSKSLRYFLEREPKAVTAVLHIFLRVVEAHLRRSSPGASVRTRCGAVSFAHRCGASLNRHLHDHCGVLDGVFEPLEAGGVQFRQVSALTPEAAAVIEQQVRCRVLRWFSRHGLLDPDDTRDRLAWANGGSSLRELSGEHT